MSLFGGGNNFQPPTLYTPAGAAVPSPAQQTPPGQLNEQTFARMALGPLEQLYIDYANAGGGDYRAFCEALQKLVAMPAVAQRVESALMFGPSQQRAPASTPAPAPAPRTQPGAFTEDHGLPPELAGLLPTLREQADAGRPVGLHTIRR